MTTSKPFCAVPYKARKSASPVPYAAAQQRPNQTSHMANHKKMKAKHIKKIRAKIKHYYVRSSYGLFGIYTSKEDMRTNGTIIYGRNPYDAIRRARRHLCIASSEYFYGYDTTCRWAQYATMPVDKPTERNIEYWK